MNDNLPVKSGNSSICQNIKHLQLCTGLYIFPAIVMAKYDDHVHFKQFFFIKICLFKFKLWNLFRAKIAINYEQKI